MVDDLVIVIAKMCIQRMPTIACLDRSDAENRDRFGSLQVLLCISVFAGYSKHLKPDRVRLCHIISSSNRSNDIWQDLSLITCL